jgi:cation-transporting ATPase E
VGASEVFLPHLESDKEREWLKALISEYSRAGKHILCVARTKASDATKAPRDIANEKLSIVAVFVLSNKLREGIRDSVNFFQERGVVIRILSGDNPETARVIASAAGIHNTDALITGAEMETWDAADFANNASKYAIFARIKPEQKEKIIEALKKDGFTAMVGDGANDALALKKADLGIAMADGSSATRQIAAVVLMGNSFTELPGGVRLADSMIENIEIFASIFMNQTFVSFLLFAAVSLAGFDFPLTPLNISFINYFAVGMPGILISYWAIRPLPKTTPVGKAPFLQRILPLPLALSVVEAVAALGLFAWAQIHGMVPAPLLIITFILSAYCYFALAPRLYSGPLASIQRIQLLVLGIIELFVLCFAFKIPLVLDFFNIAVPSFSGIEVATFLALLTGAAMFLGAQFLGRE